tara:strand:- start:704 stop:1171 length:468 start_codon:yes stop_codon:yes gene_type:complete
MIDIDKIFGMFGSDDSNENYPEPSKEEIKGIIGFDEFRTTPTYHLKMFQKVVLNHMAFQKKLIKLFKESDPEIGDFGDLEEAGQHMAFYRGWDYLKLTNLDKEMWRDCIRIQDHEKLGDALSTTLNFFESIEEYEKCAFIQKIITFLEDNLAPKN